MSEELKRCPQCGEEILAIAIKCKHCQSVLPEEQKSIWKRKLPIGWIAGITGALVLGAFAFVHVIYGGSVGFDIAKKDFPGFKDTFINVNEICGMPWIAATSEHPVAVRVLQREGYIESEFERAERINREAQENIKRFQEQAAEELEKLRRNLQN